MLAAAGVGVVRSRRRDIDALCQAAAGLLSEFGLVGPPRS